MKTVLDTAGIFLSIACAIHCSLTPIAMMLLPLWAPYLESQLVHSIAGPLVIVIACIALQRGHKTHHRRGPFVPALIGSLCLLIVPLVHNAAATHGHTHGHMQHAPLDALLSTLGGILFIIAHLWNIHLMHRAEEHWSDFEERDAGHFVADVS